MLTARLKAAEERIADKNVTISEQRVTLDDLRHRLNRARDERARHKPSSPRCSPISVPHTAGRGGAGGAASSRYPAGLADRPATLPATRSPGIPLFLRSQEQEHTA